MSDSETSPKDAGKELKDPSETDGFGESTDQTKEIDDGPTDDLHAGHVEYWKFLVVNEESGTAYPVDLSQTWDAREGSKPCPCPSSVYHQDPDADSYEVCKHVQAAGKALADMNGANAATINELQETMSELKQTVSSISANVAGLEGVIKSATAHEGGSDPSGSTTSQTDTDASQSDLSDSEAEDMVRDYLSEWVAPKLMDHVTVSARECETDQGSFYGIAVETEYVDDESTREKLNNQVRDAFDGDRQVLYTGPEGTPEYANVMNINNVRRVTDNA